MPDTMVCVKEYITLSWKLLYVLFIYFFELVANSCEFVYGLSRMPYRQLCLRVNFFLKKCMFLYESHCTNSYKITT